MNNNIILNNKEAPPLREEFAYEAIKEAILSGDLLPNQKISLSSMAESLGISIIPVKTAIQKLISEGLVRQDPHHSPVVEEFSWKETNEVLKIRYHLEDLALKEAIANIDGEGIVCLESKLNDLKEAMKNNDNHSYGKINREFHMAIYQNSKMPLLINTIEDLWNKSELNRSRSVFSLVPNMMSHSFQEHQNLVDCIKNKECEKAINLLHEHRSFSQNMLTTALETQVSKVES
jgi:DNA-binding GntR family transcriptional regulator